MKPLALIFALGVWAGLAGVAGRAADSAAAAPRQSLSLDHGWRFHLGDIAFPTPKTHDATYFSTKAGRALGAAAPDYDDTLWRELDLPHDWVVEGAFDPNENISQGYRPRGVGWYRRHFRLPVSDRGRHLELQFDGVATHCTVWFNGTLVHRNFSGYTSFTIDATPLARFGDELNTIAVRVDANPMEGWWYEGGGIYRHTWLVKRGLVHLATDGVFANPVRAADGSWTIPIEATVENFGERPAEVTVVSTLLDPEGNEVVRGGVTASPGPLESAVARFAIQVSEPRLWSVDEPTLYRVRTTLARGGEPIDETITTCGFRWFRWDASTGFYLNNRPLKIKGVCNHQDHAGVGVAVPDSLWEFRLRRLKEMGINAYRCAHHAPAAEFLDACDRLGILVMDENRVFNYTPEYMRQLEWLVRRDRNHPSVFLWSVFNEEPMQGTAGGYEMVRRMAAAVKRLDATRPVTAAMSSGFFEPVNVSSAVDVVGFNYNHWDYDRFHAEHPALPMTSSEDTSAYMTRGEYTTDLSRHVIDAYDSLAAGWGATHRAAWKAIAERPFIAGGFVWTGFDYRGEPTPLQWPSVGSFFGCLDLCGFPKTAFYLHQAQWIDDRPVLQLVPHWNWAGREGQPVKVMAITNADTVALSLNGRALGEQAADRYEVVSWEVPYAPGRLEAVAFRAGREVARVAVETVGAPVALRLIPDRPVLAGDGRDVVPVTVEAVDAAGRPVPTADLPVEFELTGPGRIIGHGNGDPNSHEPEKGNSRRLFNGLAQVLVRSTSGGKGPLTLWARGGEILPAELVIDVAAVDSPPSVAVAQPVLVLDQWRMSPVSATRPDPTVRVAGNDMNTWSTVRPGALQPFASGRWVVMRIQFSPYKAVRESGGQVVFASLTGRAEVWLDGRQVGVKESFEAGPFQVDLPAGNGERTLSVLVESDGGEPAGFSGLVTVGR